MSSIRVSLCVAAALLTACGGASQSLPGQGAAPIRAGFMRATFHVAGPLDLARYRYEIVFNTSGDGLTPEFGQHGSWAGYSDAIVATIAKNGAYAEVIQYVPNRNPHIPPTQLHLGVTPTEFQFNANSDGTNAAFTVTFERSILNANNVKVTNSWQFNAATIGKKGVADSMGSCATCFTSPKLNVSTMFDQTIDAAASSAPPSARIVDVEFANQP
jgi:hypothetical protein